METDDDEVARLLRDYEEACADYQDASSRVSSLADALAALGVTVEIPN